MLAALMFVVAIFPAQSDTWGQQPRNTLGQKGQFIIAGSSSLNLGGEHTSASGSSQSADVFTFNLDASAGRFLRSGFALGLAFGLRVDRGAGQKLTEVHIGPQFTSHIRLATTVSLLPSFAVEYQHEDISNALTKIDTVRFLLDLPFVFELGKGIGLTLGPRLEESLTFASVNHATLDLRRIAYMLRVGVVGWF